MDLSKLRRDLIISEGLRLKAYHDTVGKITIGVGRNLVDRGITTEEAMFLLDNDIKLVESEIKKLPEVNLLSEARQRVIAEMIFNLGFSRIKAFKRMWEAIRTQNWEQAAHEMLNSLWAKQVGRRAKRLAEQMRTGADSPSSRERSKSV